MEQEQEQGMAAAPQAPSMTVAMTKEFLYDFFLYHTYSKLHGFLINLLGFSVVILGGYSYWFGHIDLTTALCFLAGSALFLAATPWMLSRKAGKAMQDPMYAAPIRYTFSETEGIRAEQDGTSRLYLWEEVERAAVAPKTIIVYIGKEQALVLPKPAFGAQFPVIYGMIARHLRENYHAKKAARLAAKAAKA